MDDSDLQTSGDSLHNNPQLGGQVSPTGAGQVDPIVPPKSGPHSGVPTKEEQSKRQEIYDRFEPNSAKVGYTKYREASPHFQPMIGGSVEDRRYETSKSTTELLGGHAGFSGGSETSPHGEVKYGNLSERLKSDQPIKRGAPFKGPTLESSADKFISNPKLYKTKNFDKNMDDFIKGRGRWSDGKGAPPPSAHATDLAGNTRPTAQNIANELRNKAKPETPSSSETPKSSPSSETPRTPGGAKSHSSGFRTQGTVNLFGDVYHTATGGIKHRGSPEGDYSIQGAYDPTALSSNKNYPVKGGWHVSDYKDPTTGKLRTSVEIHSTRAGSDQLDRMFTAGCFGISRDEWPKFKEGLQQYQKDNPDKKLIWRQGKDGNAEVLAKPQSETPKSNPSSETPRTSGGATPKAPTENRPTRNNNPGNIQWGDFARAHGATEIEGQPGKGKPRFAKFPDAETGIAAHKALVIDKFGGKTISGMANKYAPPSENDTKKYTKDLMKGLDGVKATTKISDLTSDQQDLLLQNQRQMEGFHPRVESDGAVDKEVEQGKKQFDGKKGEPNKEEAPPSEPQAKEPSMTEVKDSGGGDPHTDEKLSVYKNLFL